MPVVDQSLVRDYLGALEREIAEPDNTEEKLRRVTEATLMLLRVIEPDLTPRTGLLRDLVPPVSHVIGRQVYAGTGSDTGDAEPIYPVLGELVAAVRRKYLLPSISRAAIYTLLGCLRAYDDNGYVQEGGAYLTRLYNVTPRSASDPEALPEVMEDWTAEA